MLGEDLQVVDGATAGAWIEPGLGGEWGAVSQQVPQMFGAFARVFHRSIDSDGDHVTWGEVARRLGRTAHGEMQWHQIVGSSDSSNFTGSDWPGGRPDLGGMEIEELDRLCEVLAAHIVDPDRCFFGLCLINHSWMWEALPTAEQQPQLKLPLGRDHLILSGPLSAVDQIRTPENTEGLSSIATFSFTAVAEGSAEPGPELDMADAFWREAPSLIWPADRSWLVVSEVDFDSTLVGGSRELIDALVAYPDLEIYEVQPETLLTEFSDKLNPVPEPEDG